MMKIRLSEIAKSQGKNMSQVQRESGLTMGMINRYWHNRSESIVLEAIETLCELLGVTVGEMIVSTSIRPES